MKSLKGETLDMSNRDENNKMITSADNQKETESSGAHAQKDVYVTVLAPPDGGYGWVVVFAVALSLFFGISGPMCFGIFMIELLEQFEVTKTYLSWVGTLQMVIAVPTSLYATRLLKRCGPRMVIIIASLLIGLGNVLNSLAPNIPFLFFSIGIVTGTGTHLMYISSRIPVQTYFHKKRSLAASLQVMGSGTGLFIWPPLVRFLIDTFAWRGAYLIIGGICLNGIVLGSLLRPAPTKSVLKERIEDEGDEKVIGKHGEKQAKTISHWCLSSLPFLLMFLGWFCAFSGQVVIVTFTPLRAQLLGFTKSQGVWILSAIGITSCMCRVIFGWYGDKSAISRLTLIGISVSFCGLVTCCSLLVSSFELLLVYAAVFGIGLAAYKGLEGASIYDVVGLKNIERGNTILSAAFGLSSFYALPLAGLLYDLTGKAFASVLLFGIIQTLGGICFPIIPIVQKYISNRLKQDDVIVKT